MPPLQKRILLPADSLGSSCFPCGKLETGIPGFKDEPAVTGAENGSFDAHRWLATSVVDHSRAEMSDNGV